MSNLHIMNTDKFVEPFISFINKEFSIDDHIFVCINTFGENHLKVSYKNLHETNTFFEIINLIKGLDSIEKVFLHGLFDKKVLFLLLFKPSLLRKSYWVVWGGDLYSFRELRTTIKSRVLETLKKFITKRIKYIITLVEGDYMLAKKWYNARGGYLHGAYVSPITIEYLNSLPQTIKDESSPLIIQVGNSADPSNNHIEAFKRLEKFKEENILIYVPLSYGDKDNARKVTNDGFKRFGEKFIPMAEYLSPDEYSSHLNSIDVAIFNNDRQQALGNIYAFLYLEKNVFIRSDTTMWMHFTNKFDVSISDFLNIDKKNLKELKTTQGLNNKDKIKKVFTQQYVYSIWDEIFKTR